MNTQNAKAPTPAPAALSLPVGDRPTDTFCDSVPDPSDPKKHIRPTQPPDDQQFVQAINC